MECAGLPIVHWSKTQDRSARRSCGRLGVVAGAAVLLTAAAARATLCTAPDSSGTATLPPACSYVPPSDTLYIIDGLPPGSTIAIGVEHKDFTSIVAVPGGSLGGERQTFQSKLSFSMNGTGGLAGYSRSLQLTGVSCETHSAPRTPGSLVQSFDTDFYQLQGQLPPGDPDFDLLRITAGTGFGLPSPGHTTLTRSGGTWNVDSFFDITYRIDFIGAPGSPLAGRSGSTTGTIRMQAGQSVVFDHLECFIAKDPLKLKGVVDLPALAGGLYSAAGCTIGKAKKYCTPVAKIVTASDVPVTPMGGPPLTSDYVCYLLKCPKIALTQGIVDQFGTRVLDKLKQKELCVPAARTP